MEPKNYTTQIQKMEDTLFHTFPTVNRVSVEVKTDFGTEINITLGDVALYQAPDAARQEVVEQTTAIVKHVFAPEVPEKGKIIFVEEEHTTNTNPETMKKYDLPLGERK